MECLIKPTANKWAIHDNKTNFIESSMTYSEKPGSACLTPNDGYDDGVTMCTRANITINTAPPKVTLAEPAHGNNTITNRSINFRWSLSLIQTEIQ